MYKFVQYVDSDEYNPDPKQFKEPHEAEQYCAKHYAEKLGITQYEATKILNNATIESRQYAKVIGDDPRGYKLEITVGPGRTGVHLISKTFGIPLGLWDEIQKEYDTTTRTIVSLVVGLLGGGSFATLVIFAFSIFN